MARCAERSTSLRSAPSNRTGGPFGGTIRDLGVDAVPAELTDLDRSWLARKLGQYELLPAQGVDHFTKIVAGKQLWNYDNLEPTEKKLIL